MKTKNIILLLCNIALMGQTLHASASSGITLYLNKSGNGSNTLSFEGDPWTNYEVQTSTSLAHPNWLSAGVIEGSESAWYEYNDGMTQNQLFYRIRALGMTSHMTVRRDFSSPQGNVVGISRTNVTTNITLGIYDIVSHGASGTLEGADILITSGSANLSGDIAAIRMKVGSSVYNGTVVNSGQGFLYLIGFLDYDEYDYEVKFSGMNIPLPADASVPVTISADIAPDTSGSMDGTDISIGYSQLFDLMAVTYTNNEGGDPLPLEAQLSPTSLTLVDGDVVVSGAGAGIGLKPWLTTNITESILTNSVTKVKTNGVIIYTTNYYYTNITVQVAYGYIGMFSFTVTANDQALYLQGIGIAIQSGGTSCNVTSISADPSLLAGDGPTYGRFIVPTGTSRTFYYTFIVTKSPYDPTVEERIVSMSGIYLIADDGTPINVTHGLDQAVWFQTF